MWWESRREQREWVCCGKNQTKRQESLVSKGQVGTLWQALPGYAAKRTHQERKRSFSGTPGELRVKVILE